MGNKLYVGNLPYSVRDSDLERLWRIWRRESARSDGARDRPLQRFAFVEMGSDAEAQAAITA